MQILFSIHTTWDLASSLLPSEVLMLFTLPLPDPASDDDDAVVLICDTMPHSIPALPSALPNHRNACADSLKRSANELLY